MKRPPFPRDAEAAAILLHRIQLARYFRDWLARYRAAARRLVGYVPHRPHLAPRGAIGFTVAVAELCRHTGQTEAQVTFALEGWNAWTEAGAPAVRGITVLPLPGSAAGALYRVTFDGCLPRRT
ncbi:MAG TPA: hypothetical protein VHS99_26015 [Chloroflexota bacterium]|nr:hypothetical protein [Chloroflexota bacterium]